MAFDKSHLVLALLALFGVFGLFTTSSVPFTEWTGAVVATPPPNSLVSHFAFP